MHKTKHRRKHKLHKKHFATPALAIAICAVLMLEGAMLGVVSGDVVKSSLKIFDISDKVLQTKLDLVEFADPFASTVKSVETFYRLAAAETSIMLQQNIVDHSITLISNVDRFYLLASSEMSALIDLTM